MKRLIVITLVLSGCAASFQPFPSSVTREEIAVALKERDENIKLLAEKIAEIAQAKIIKK